MDWDGLSQGVNVIYGLSEPGGAVRYIGQTINMHRRFNDHARSGYKQRNRYGNWMKKLRRLGVKPELHVLEVVAQANDLDMIESFWIASIQAAGGVLLNGTSGGGSPGRGRVCSPETRAKIGAANAIALKGRPSPFKGMKRVITPAIAKHLAKLRNRKHTQAENDKRSVALRGRCRPPDVIAKISDGHLLRGGRRVFCLETGVVHRSAGQAAAAHGVSKRTIYLAIIENRPIKKGFRFRYDD